MTTEISVVARCSGATSRAYHAYNPSEHRSPEAGWFFCLDRVSQGPFKNQNAALEARSVAIKEAPGRVVSPQGEVVREA